MEPRIGLLCGTGATGEADATPNYLPLRLPHSPAQQRLPGGEEVARLVWWGQAWQQALQGKVHKLR